MSTTTTHTTTRHTPPPPAEKPYRRAYERAWKWVQNMPAAAWEMGGLEYADRKGWTDTPGWEDGYTDADLGRAKWHAWHERAGSELNCGCVL